MTVSAQTPSVTYSCTGTTTYTYAFRVFLDSDIVVKKYDTDGVPTTLTLTTDYTVSGAGDATGGSIETVATYSSGTLLIRRVLPYTQPSVLSDAGPLPSDTLEDGLDRNVMLMQQMNVDVEDASPYSEAAAASAVAAALSATSAAADAITCERIVAPYLPIWDETAVDKTLVAGEGWLFDTSAAVKTATLPASPTVGHVVGVGDLKDSFDSYALTIARNGNKIMGEDDDLYLRTRSVVVVLRYSGSDQGWRIIHCTPL